mmetsp:Transcript_11352/g.16636  ORF Transcript_11352/g.16636 Transcript_11352/m.16636 type:complete len:101 (-) Transcript_11352:736-1038(-)
MLRAMRDSDVLTKLRVESDHEDDNDESIDAVYSVLTHYPSLREFHFNGEGELTHPTTGQRACLLRIPSMLDLDKLWLVDATLGPEYHETMMTASRDISIE